LTTSASAPILPSLGSFVRLPNKGGGLSWRNRQSRAPSTFVRPDTPYCLVQSNADGSTHRGGDLRQSAMRSEMTASDQLRPTGSSIRGSPRGLAVQRQALCSHGPRRSGEAARLIHETPAEFLSELVVDERQHRTFDPSDHATPEPATCFAVVKRCQLPGEKVPRLLLLL
jgi:hypothetical protein